VELQILLQSLNPKPKVIIITEVNPKRIDKGLHESEFSILGYNMFCKNVGVDKCRGIIIYVDNSIYSTELDISSTFSEFILIQLKDKTSSILTIGSFYRSPNSTKENDKNLVDLFNHINLTINGKILLVGDFNFRNINWGSWTTSSGPQYSDNKFLDCLRQNLFEQHVTFPTRARGTNTPHTLDLIISNGNLVFDVSNMSPLGKSDHSVVTCTCKIKLETCIEEKFRYDKGDYEGLRLSISSLLNQSELNIDVNSLWENIKNILLNAIKEYVPSTVGDSWKKRSPEATILRCA